MRVTADAIMSIQGVLQRLADLTEDSPAPAYVVPGPIPIEHEDGWIIGEAVFEDDQWWVDFAKFGSDK